MLKPPIMHLSSAPRRPVRRHHHFTLEAALLQVFSVVVGILLALAVSSAQQSLHNRQTVTEALSDIRQEVGDNRAALAADLADGARLHAKVDALVKGHAATRRLSFADFFAVWSQHRDSLYAPSSAAWDTAQSVQAPALMPYKTRLLLSQVYAAQHSLLDHHTEVGLMLDSPDLMKQDTLYYSLLSMNVHLDDEMDDERRLLSLYDAALARLK